MKLPPLSHNCMHEDLILVFDGSDEEDMGLCQWTDDEMNVLNQNPGLFHPLAK